MIHDCTSPEVSKSCSTVGGLKRQVLSSRTFAREEPWPAQTGGTRAVWLAH